MMKIHQNSFITIQNYKSGDEILDGRWDGLMVDGRWCDLFFLSFISLFIFCLFSQWERPELDEVWKKEKKEK